MIADITQADRYLFVSEEILPLPLLVYKTWHSFASLVFWIYALLKQNWFHLAFSDFHSFDFTRLTLQFKTTEYRESIIADHNLHLLVQRGTYRKFTFPASVCICPCLSLSASKVYQTISLPLLSFTPISQLVSLLKSYQKETQELQSWYICLH